MNKKRLAAFILAACTISLSLGCLVGIYSGAATTEALLTASASDIELIEQQTFVIKAQKESIRRKEAEILRLQQAVKNTSRSTVSRHSMGTFKVTAYSPYDNVNGMQADGDPSRTATGTVPGPGTMAVDPNVIPYGSTIVVIYSDGSVEVGRAEDCGGAVRKNHLDVFRQTFKEATKLGVQKATVLWY